jgi:hypothetical protein
MEEKVGFFFQIVLMMTGLDFCSCMMYPVKAEMISPYTESAHSLSAVTQF